MAFKNLLYIPFFLLIACQGDDTASEMDSTDDMQAAEFELITTPLSNITQIKATAGGTIDGVLLNEIEELGVVYSTSSNPSTNDTTIAAAIALDFAVQLDNLDVNTQYFLRAYVILNGEILYGNERSFITLDHKEFNGIPLLTSQANIDMFFSQGWSKIGGLIIKEEVEGDITNLSALSSLVIIGTDGPFTETLQIENNKNLQSLDGLQNVKTVGGILLANNGLLDISQLENLEEINGSVRISNEPLNNLIGLHNLKMLQFTLQISTNENLQSLEDLESLETIGEDIIITSNPTLSNFCALTLPVANGFSGFYTVFDNFYNPTQEDITNENCSI